jgi:four helix bundle protein
MATFERFEDIEAWKIGREVTNHLYALTNRGSFARDFALRDQMRRASISITSNIAEGFERDGAREFIQFLSNSKGSTGELRSQIYVARDQQYISQADFDSLYDQLSRISRMNAGLMNYLQNTNYRGTKYK